MPRTGFATPLPLSFLGVMLASASFSGVELHWVPAAQAHVVALVALLATAPMQLLAAVLAFSTRDPSAGTGAAVLAGSWAVVGTTTVTSPPGSHSSGLGLVLLVAACALVVPVAAGVSKPLAAVVMATSGLRFAVTGVYQLVATSAWREAAGLLGLVLSGVALYAALAYELEDVHGRAVLPTGGGKGVAGG